MADYADEELEGLGHDVEPEVTTTPAVAAQESATGQSAELAHASGASDPSGAQASEAKEAERAAAARKSWEDFLGAKLGGKLFELVQKNVSYDDLLGHAKKASESLGDALKDAPLKPTDKGALGGALDEQAEADAVNKMLAALAPAIQAQVDKWIETETGQKVLTAISQWVEEHPKTVVISLGAALVGAAVAAYVSNMDPPEFEQTFKLGKRFKAGLGVDVGPLQSWTIQAASASIQYEGPGMKAKVEVRHDLEKKTTTASASVSGETRIGQTEGKGAADVSLDDAGRVAIKVKGDLNSVIGHTPLSVGAGASHATGGGKDDATRLEGRISVGEKGEERTATGHYDPTTKAFGFTLTRNFMDGAGSLSHTTESDANGDVTTTREASMKAGEGQSLSLSQSTGPGGETAGFQYDHKDAGGSGVDLRAAGTAGAKDSLSLGAGFDLGKFRNELDYQMDDGVHSLGLRSSANLDDELSIGFNLDYDLTNARVDEMGAKLGWKDTDQFRSFTLEYKGRWLQDNPGYEHGFDAAFEYAVGNLSGRVKAGVDLQDGGVSGTRASALAGYKLNENWAVIGGVQYEGNRGAGGMQHTVTPEVGFQYKDVAITVGYQQGRDDGAVTVGLKIPLGW